MNGNCCAVAIITLGVWASVFGQTPFVEQNTERIVIRTSAVEAAVRRRGYVSGVEAQSFLDRRTGFRDPGFGLDIVDWLLEPGSDTAYRAQLDPELVYSFGNLVHGQRAKRSVEGPQICTKAGSLNPRIVVGGDFVAIEQQYRYHIAAPGRQSGSVWIQRLVFPNDTRYFIAMDEIQSANSSDALFLRIDMPGHIKHRNGDTFDEVYLSYITFTNDNGGYTDGRIPAEAFREDFPPDARFHYVRNDAQLPERFIRACKLRDPQTGNSGPWLAGMTLDSGVVSEAWCHQRGYVCMIQEIGGRSVKPGDTFGGAYIVGYFDSIAEMHQVYDRYKGANSLEVDQSGWRLSRR